MKFALIFQEPPIFAFVNPSQAAHTHLVPHVHSTSNATAASVSLDTVRACVEENLTVGATNLVVRSDIFPTESFMRAVSPIPPMPKLDNRAMTMACGAERTARPDTATFINSMDTIWVPPSIVDPFVQKKVIATLRGHSPSPVKW